MQVSSCCPRPWYDLRASVGFSEACVAVSPSGRPSVGLAFPSLVDELCKQSSCAGCIAQLDAGPLPSCVAGSSASLSSCVGRSWIWDTGASFDLIGRDRIGPFEDVSKCSRRHLSTAGGPLASQELLQTSVGASLHAQALVLPQCPPVLSVGSRLEDEGWGSFWVGGQVPFVLTPQLDFLELRVEEKVPFVDDSQPVGSVPRALVDNMLGAIEDVQIAGRSSIAPSASSPTSSFHSD